MRSSKPLHDLLADWTCYRLVDGPSAWLFGVHRPGWEAEPSLEALRQEHARVDPLYRGAIAAAQASQAEKARELGRELERLLMEHLRHEEEHLFPRAAAVLDPPGRILRELGYEHQGIRAGLVQLAPMLEEILAGRASVKQVEKLELDLLHMFEHHQEREEEALFPWLERVL